MSDIRSAAPSMVFACGSFRRRELGMTCTVANGTLGDAAQLIICLEARPD